MNEGSIYINDVDGLGERVHFLWGVGGDRQKNYLLCWTVRDIFGFYINASHHQDTVGPSYPQISHTQVQPTADPTG